MTANKPNDPHSGFDANDLPGEPLPAPTDGMESVMNQANANMRYRYIRNQQSQSILIAGTPSAGRTTMFRSLTLAEFPDPCPPDPSEGDSR
ncbi:MAG: hypothetical protein ACR2P2_11810 [Nakamurella sp.]